MKISTRARYAVEAIATLARADRNGAPISLASLSESQELPLTYLEQIFARLRKAGIVRSVRGPGGGYLLARAPSELTIGEIFVAVDEPIDLTRCLSNDSKTECRRLDLCQTKNLWASLHSDFNQLLFTMTIDRALTDHPIDPARFS